MVGEGPHSGETRLPSVFRSRSRLLAALTLTLLSACAVAPVANRGGAPVSDGFTNFETEPVRPLVLSSDGRRVRQRKKKKKKS